MFVVTFVYFKLSIFQRHHAQKRVFKYVAKNTDDVLNPLKHDILPA
jgi:uncharacterized protein YggT (Ycf19 family)